MSPTDERADSAGTALKDSVGNKTSAALNRSSYKKLIRSSRLVFNRQIYVGELCLAGSCFLSIRDAISRSIEIQFTKR